MADEEGLCQRSAPNGGKGHQGLSMDEQDSTWHESYIAFMLRLWRTGSQSGNPLWRASLEDPVTGTRLAFSDINALFAFLSDRTCSRVVTSEPEAADDTTGTLSADESTPL